MDARDKKVCLVSLLATFILVLPVAFAVNIAKNDEYRTWTDTSGKYRVEASLVSQSETQVTLLNRDGKEISVAKEKLCADDLAYLKTKAGESMVDQAPEKTVNDGIPSNATDVSIDRSSQARHEDQPEQNEIKQLAESFFDDLRTKDRSIAKSLLTSKAHACAAPLKRNANSQSKVLFGTGAAPAAAMAIGSRHFSMLRSVTPRRCAGPLTACNSMGWHAGGRTRRR